jgi:hypothetical protein
MKALSSNIGLTLDTTQSSSDTSQPMSNNLKVKEIHNGNFVDTNKLDFSISV